jgi:hypothetical protein
MSSKLMNVRLDEERSRKARALRENGVSLSDIVREAIDERFEKLSNRRKRRDVKTIIATVFQQYPDPPGLRPRTYDVHDSRQVRTVIRQRLLKKP